MPVENKIHQGCRTIPHLVWLSFTFQHTCCLPGEFIIDQRQWSSLPKPPLFPPSFPISSFLPAVTIFSIPAYQLPAQGYVKGVCKSCKALGKACGVVTRMGMKEKGPVHAASVGTEPSSHGAHSPLQAVLQRAAGDIGEAEIVSPETRGKMSWIQSKDEAWTMN